MRGRIAWTLLLASSLTVMAGAIIAPSLTGMAAAFADTERVELMTRLVLTTPALAIALTATTMGLVVDRLGRRPVLVGGLLLYAVAGTSGMWLNSLEAILVGRFALGLAVGAIMTAATTLITDLFDGTRRGRFLGLQAAFMGLGGMVFLLGGGALADLGWRSPFTLYIAALLLVPAALALPEARRPSAAEGAAASPPLSRETRRTVWGMLAIGFTGMLMLYCVPVQLPFHVRQMLDAGGLATGAAIASVTVTSSLASLFFPRILSRVGNRGAVALTFAMSGVGFATVGLATSWPVLIAGLLVAGAGFGLLMPNLATWLAMISPPSHRGRLIGALTTSYFAGQFVSPLLAAPLVVSRGLGGAGGLFALGGYAALAVAALLSGAGLRRRAVAAGH